jgi:hypothetical protein
MRLQIKIDTNKTIKKFVDKTKKERIQQILMAHGEHEIEEARRRILVTKMAPDNTPWSAWRPSTERWRRSMPQTYRLGLLLLTQRMVNSFFYYVKSKSLHLINNTPYSVFLQYGTPQMVARRFLDTNARGLKQRIMGYLKS